MFFKEPKKVSYLFSISVHAIFVLWLVFTSIGANNQQEDYLLVGFGPGFGMGGGGAAGQGNQPGSGGLTPETPPEKKVEDKKVDLPKSDQLKDEDAIASPSKKKNEDETSASKVKPLFKSNNKGDGFGYGPEGNGTGGGGFGFELDFGGRGVRRIYSYSLPEYPEGVSKEIDLRLRFTILPDGTVSNIIPLIKADARLEMTAINSLRQWRFEPLPSNAKQLEQTVVITFPYRLQ
ncbi:MAG: TonB family protein [Bacteroidetes bacterium]|nr:TonB family protein [Bacteroidota bacterium]